MLNRWQQKFSIIHRKRMTSLYNATCQERETAREAAGIPSRNSRKRKEGAATLISRNHSSPPLNPARKHILMLSPVYFHRLGAAAAAGRGAAEEGAEGIVSMLPPPVNTIPRGVTSTRPELQRELCPERSTAAADKSQGAGVDGVGAGGGDGNAGEYLDFLSLQVNEGDTLRFDTSGAASDPAITVAPGLGVGGAARGGGVGATGGRTKRMGAGVNKQRNGL